MARDKALLQNIDGSDIINYPHKRIRDNDGSNNGTPVSEAVYGDMHEFFAHIMDESKTDYNNLPDNVSNSYQYYDALMQIGTKNSIVKNMTLDSNLTTVRFPIKLNILKNGETVVFKSTFDSTNIMNLAIGFDGNTKPLSISGTFKNGYLSRLTNDNGIITLTGLYDSENVPNLVNRLNSLEAIFNTISKKLSVFQAGGGMLFWNKPANTIPDGWQEVEDWRGRFPVGLLETDSDFATMGKTGGEKTHTLTINEMPKHRHQYDRAKNYGSASGNAIGHPDLGFDNVATDYAGGDQPHNNLPPYRTVLFIEYIG